MTRTDYEARVGTILRDKWTLERLIGVGGMAAVYVGKHKIGRQAAIKVLHAEIAMDAQVRARFEQEALAVNSVGHRGVVEIIDIDTTEDGSLFLVMELLKGETMADRVEKKGLLSEKAMLNVADEVLDVLIACHKKDIVHRDIKPENLFLLADGGIKVLDFGIARVRQGVKTMAGTMLGTVAFMPPEQIKGTEVDHRADLFALGATMFTCMAGRRLHKASSDAQLASMMLTRAAPRFAEVYPRASEGLALLVDRALAFLPERRYPDALTMRGDVWAVRRGERPPYANACEKAGQSAQALSLDDDQDKPATSTPIESTRPQMPVFVEDDATAKPRAKPRPAAGRRAAQPRSELPATTPQMPVFDAPTSTPSVADRAADHTPDSREAVPPPRPSDEAASAPSERPESATAAGQAPASVPPSSAPSSTSGSAPASQPPSADAAPASQPAAGDAGEATTSQPPPSSGPDSTPSTSSVRPNRRGADSEPPVSDGALSWMPESTPPPPAATAPKDDDKPAPVASGGGAGWTILAIILFLLAIALFVAWRMGIITGLPA